MEDSSPGRSRRLGVERWRKSRSTQSLALAASAAVSAAELGKGWSEGGGAVPGSFDLSESPYLAAGLRMDPHRILWTEMQKYR